MEQCSSEATASYKSSLVKGGSVIDLTGGFGIDLSFISKNFEKSIYVEKDEWLCKLAEHNYSYLNPSVDVKHLKASIALDGLSEVDLIYLDSARRNTVAHKVI